MGMPFALGMRLASSFPRAPTAWFWGINGAMSVCGSVIAMIISLASGTSAAYAAGMGCYLIAVLAFWALQRRLPGAA